MAYKALYREYRPQTFDEVVGQKQIVQTLKNSIKEGRIAHAYLFTGPRGTGKTTIAKLIAKAVNCTCDGEKPCGKCKNCLDIANGTYPDVIEIDAASNNNVDQAREIIEQVKYSPVEGKYKVYIIDEVHMMTSGAFNALLKTLEEPPAHVIFILATTEVHKVLPTIISRCQRFDFGRVSDVDLARKVEEVLGKENINYEHGVPQLIARLADGGVRDALSILDQSISYSPNRLTCKDVREIYGVLSTEESIEFIKLFHNSDVNNCLLKIDDFDRRGIDIPKLTTYLIDIFKDLIVYNKTGSNEHFTLLNLEEAKKLSSFVDSKTAFTYIDVLLDASLTYKRINSPRSYFELTCLKLCNCEKTMDVVEKVVEPVQEPVIQEVKTETVVEEQPVVVEEQPETISQEEPIVEQEQFEEAVEETIEPEEAVIDEKEEEKPQEPTISIENTMENEQNVDTVSIEKVAPAEPITDMFEIKRICLNYMVNGSKELKSELDHMWNAITKYCYIPKYQKAANALRDGCIAVACPNAILIQMGTVQEAEIARSPEMFYECKELIKELFHKEYTFFTVSGSQLKSAIVSFVQLRDTNRLPKPEPITDIYTVEACKAVAAPVEEQKTEEEKLGFELFGDLLEVK